MNADSMLLYGSKLVSSHLDGLDNDQTLIPNVCGIWSTKQIIAHLASMEKLWLEAFEMILGSEAGKTLTRFYEVGPEKFNDIEVADRESLSFSDTLDEFLQTEKKLISAFANIPLETRRKNGIFPAYGEDFDLEDVVAYSIYSHKQEHMAQVAVFRDTLGSWELGE